PPGLAHLGERQAGSANDLEVGRRVPPDVGAPADEPDADDGAPRGQVSRDDEAVTAVVALPADHRNPPAARRAEAPLEGVGRPPAGILHEQQARNTEAFCRAAIRASHLLGSGDADHARPAAPSGSPSARTWAMAYSPS